MVFDLSGGSGGARLNFKIVSYKSESELLNDTPQENTIGVITENDISSWIFSSKQPSNPSDKMLWIKTGDSSSVEFNALKKNGVMITPLVASYYTLGVWKPVTAKSFRNNKWVDWFIYLYNLGDDCADLTGGWATYKYKTDTSGSDVLMPTLEVKNTSIRISFSSSGYKAGALFTEKTVDLTHVSTLEIDVVDVGSVADTVYIGVSATKANNYQAVARQVIYERNIGSTVELDISGITGAYYVFVHMQGTGKNHIEFSSIRMR